MQNMQSLKNINFSNTKVLVVGDIMLDEYWHGDTARISPEAPVPVVKVEDTDYRPGGAGNVAINLAALGCNVELLAVTGKDSSAIILEQLLDTKNVRHHLIKSNDFHTITKLRILSQGQQLMRLDKEQELTLGNKAQLIELYRSLLMEKDVVVLSDYSKGTLTECKELIKIAKSLNIPVIVDPKSTDFSLYTGALLVTPNLKEFEQIVGKCSSKQQIIDRARNLLVNKSISEILVTMGDKGMMLINADEQYYVAANSTEVYDVTGAGDTVLSAMAACIAKGVAMPQAIELASIAAGIVVGKVGTSIVSLDEIKQKVLRKDDVEQGVIDKHKVKTLIKSCQTKGQKIVFANGCYDVLHYGHIRFLDAAKECGDRLVVAINSDDSIKRLKGKSRPINNLSNRMEVLAGLKSVDWVVFYDEDTPGEVVKFLNPDILAKTAENYPSIDEVPENEGAKHVLARGGDIKLIGRTPGCSSTEIINACASEAEIID